MGVKEGNENIWSLNKSYIFYIFNLHQVSFSVLFSILCFVLNFVFSYVFVLFFVTVVYSRNLLKLYLIVEGIPILVYTLQCWTPKILLFCRNTVHCLRGARSPSTGTETKDLLIPREMLLHRTSKQFTWSK